MYSAWRTAVRPLRLDRWFRMWPRSCEHGASPISAVKTLQSRWPNAGKKTTNMAAVKEPIPPSGPPTIREGCIRLEERVAAYGTLRDPDGWPSSDLWVMGRTQPRLKPGAVVPVDHVNWVPRNSNSRKSNYEFFFVFLSIFTR